MQSEELLQLMIGACDDKRAEDIMKFNVTETSSVTDYYIICHGTSDRQVQAIADEIKEVAKDHGIEPVVEGYREAKWILCDIENVVIHVFHKPERDYYNLERLFQNGEHVEV